MQPLKITPSYTNRDSRVLETYFQEIGRKHPVSPGEEVALAQKIRQGDQAALDKLVVANLRFVVSIAKKYQHQGLCLSDLIAEGNLGLIEAAKRFDETKGFKFISYAVWWIRQQIIAAIAEQTRLIRLPRNQIDLIMQARNAGAALEQAAERQPTLEELASYLETPEWKLKEALYHAPFPVSLDRPCRDGEDEYSLLDREPAEETADAALQNAADSEAIRLLLNGLPCRERDILRLQFGLDGDRPYNGVETGERVGMSAENVRVLRAKALTKLRNHPRLPEIL